MYTDRRVFNCTKIDMTPPTSPTKLKRNKHEWLAALASVGLGVGSLTSRDHITSTDLCHLISCVHQIEMKL